MSSNSNSHAADKVNANLEGTPGPAAGNGAQLPPRPSWFDHPAGPYFGGQDWPMNPGPPNPHSRASVPYPPGYAGPYSATPYPPLYGPKDAPHGPYLNQPLPSGSGSNTAPAIDPALVGLPDDDDDDNDLGDKQPPAKHKLLSKVAKPVSKVAGSRRSAPALSAKAKGKQKAAPKRKGADLEDEPEAKRRRGRLPGTANYTDEDLDTLLDYIEVYLPSGALRWNNVGDDFNEWAASVGRPERTAKSLENKFKQLVRTSKPTGDAECPPHIERAHLIEDMINDKVETRVLDDSEIADIIEVSDDDEIDNDDDDDDDADDADNDTPPPKKTAPVKSTTATRVTAPKAKVKKERSEVTGPVARRPPADRIVQPRARSSRNEASELLSSISTALNPATQAARDDERSTRTLQTTQLLTMSQTLRDAQITNESLRTQLQQAQQELNEANRRADRAELLGLIDRRPGPGPRSDDHDHWSYGSTTRRFSRHELNSPSAARLRRQRRLYDSPRPSSHYGLSPRRRRRDNTPSPRYRSFPDASPAAPTPTPPRPDHRVRMETFYHDGGRMVSWVGGDDEDDFGIPPRYSVSPGTIRYTVNQPSPTPRNATPGPSKSVAKHGNAA